MLQQIDQVLFLVIVGTQLIVELVKRLCDEFPVVVSVTESGIG